MTEKGCASYILGGAFKGAVMGGLFGAAAGTFLRKHPSIILQMSMKGACVFAGLKALIGGLIC